MNQKPMTAWTVTCRAVRASDGDVKYAALRCRLPVTKPEDAIALAVRNRLHEIRRLLPGYELSDWTATQPQQGRRVNLS